MIAFFSMANKVGAGAQISHHCIPEKDKLVAETHEMLIVGCLSYSLANFANFSASASPVTICFNLFLESKTAA
jgi:hypothetical protein